MDPHDDQLGPIRWGSGNRRSGLLHHFNEQCEPTEPSALRPIRPGRVPDEEWDGSAERRAIVDMLARCWPSERSQRQ